METEALKFYSVTSKGTVINKKTGKEVKVKNGKVKLTVNGKRSTYKIDSLKKEPKPSFSKLRKDSRLQKVREAYEENNNFDIDKFVKKTGIFKYRVKL